jgi:hypothetical protein
METRDLIDQMSIKIRYGQDWNFYKSKKLIWHSIRLFHFGINVQRFGQLTNYTEANYLYEDLLALEYRF